MGHEYWIEVSPPEAYAALKPDIARFLRELPSCVLEVSESDFLLRDPNSGGAWDHDVRVMLEPCRVYVLASVMGAVFRRDIRALLERLAQSVRVSLVDEAGDSVDLRDVFATPFERALRRCVIRLEAFARAWSHDPMRDPHDDEVHLGLEGLLRFALDDDRGCDGVLELRASGDHDHLELGGLAVWLEEAPPARLRVQLELRSGCIVDGVVQLATGAEPSTMASDADEDEAWLVVARLPGEL